MVSLHTGVPGGRAQRGHEGLQQPTNENKRVFPGDDKVKQWQDDGGVDEQAANDSNSVHSQLAAHGCDVIHLHNLTGNQKEDADRGVPEGQRSSLFIRKIEMVRSSYTRYTRHLPHDYRDQPHDRFIETVKEVPEGLSLFPHASYDQTKAEGEHHQTKCIDSIN